MRWLLFTSIVAVGLSAAGAQAANPKGDSVPRQGDAAPPGGQVMSMERLPIDGLNVQVMQGTEGLVFASPNGHYMIRGEIWDLWDHGKKLKTMDDVRKGSAINVFSRPGLDFEKDYDPIRAGNGPKKVAIIVDPKSASSIALLSHLQPLFKDYSFYILVVPLLGKETGDVDATKILDCATDRAAAVRALLANKLEGAGLQQKAECDLLPLQKRWALARAILEVRKVPYVVTEDGRWSNGAPPDLAVWLSGRKS
jgi:thiol:disulfide interchange protein DsbC